MRQKGIVEKDLRKAHTEERKIVDTKTEGTTDGFTPYNHGKRQQLTKKLQNYGTKEMTCGTQKVQR